MPRDFRTCRPRLRSPLLSRSRNTSQVSTSEEIAASCPFERTAHLQIGEHGGDPFLFQEVHQPHQGRLDFQRGAARVQTGDRIDDHHVRREFGDELDRAREMHFQAELKRPHGLKLEPVLFSPTAASRSRSCAMLRMIWLGDSSNEK